MRRWEQGVLATALVAATLAWPASAFEIFGIRLWGEDEDEQVEIIDPLPYTVEMAVTGGEDGLEAALQSASALWSERETPASGRAGLLSRARGDYRRILAALYSQGHYAGVISIRAAGREVAELPLSATLPAEVPVEIAVEAGPPFRFGRAEILNAPDFVEEGADAVEEPESIGFAPGEPALAAAVREASALAVEQWRQRSYAKAEETGREVVADHTTNQLDVVVALDPGRPARFGPVAVSGTRRVDPEFVTFMTGLQTGQSFDPDAVAAARARLGRTGVFRSIRVDEAEAIGPDGSLPMEVQVQEREPRTIGFGASLSTIDGAGLEAYWLHRNLFGRAEQLRFDAGVLGLGAQDPEEFTYNLGVTFVKPGVYTPDTDFLASLVGRQENFETYEERSLTGRVGLSQSFGSKLTGELFFEVSRSRIEDDLGTRNFLTFGPIVRAEYDRRDDPLEPTSGYWLAADFQPFYEAEFGNVAARGTLEGRAYRGFGEEDRFVLAGRARVGVFGGADAEESPPGLLFFAGGGGSVRGYAFRSIGVEVPGEEDEVATLGGRSLVEASAELRVRVTERFGAVGFVDGGYVGENSTLGDAELRLGAGLGLRYFTGFGALRVDLATPIDPRPQDDAVALYIGIGQAF